MAYPLVDAAYGFKPINELNGLPYAGAIRQIPIPYNFGTSLFNGDLVELTNGTVRKTQLVETTAASTTFPSQIGVFVGCSYTSPSTGQKLFAQYYPANTAANDIVAYVVDDDRAVFKTVMIAQTGTISNTATAIGYANQAFVGANLYSITGTAGSTTTGNSKMGLSGSCPTNGSGNVRVTTSAPFRVVGVVPETAVTLSGVGSTSGSSATVTLTAAVTGLQAGMQLICSTGTGTTAGGFITVTNVNSTTLTVNTPVTLASGSALSFVGFPEVLVKWNQGYHGYQNAIGI